MSALVYAIIEAPAAGWTDPVILVSFAVAVLAAAGVFRQHGLGPGQGHGARRHQRHLDAPGRGEQDVVAHDLRLQTGFAHPRRDQFGDAPRPVRPRHVGRTRELRVLRFAARGGRQGQQRRLQVALPGRRLGREAQGQGIVAGTCGNGEEQAQRGHGRARGLHVARIVPEAARPGGAEPAW